MVFCVGEVVVPPGLENPAVVAVTDRNDLDDQTLRPFSRGEESLRQRQSSTIYPGNPGQKT